MLEHQDQFVVSRYQSKCCPEASKTRVVPARLLNLPWKHISLVKAIWPDLEKGICKQHKAKWLRPFDTDTLILSTRFNCSEACRKCVEGGATPREEEGLVRRIYNRIKKCNVQQCKQRAGGGDLGLWRPADPQPLVGGGLLDRPA